MIKNENNVPMYIFEDAVKFISNRSKLSTDIIREVLELEEGYMREIGIIVEDEEVEK